MTLQELKGAYNVLIKREKLAEKYLEDNSYTQAKKDSWIPEFNKITECLSMLMIDYKKITGEEMSNENVLEGFR